MINLKKQHILNTRYVSTTTNIVLTDFTLHSILYLLLWNIIKFSAISLNSVQRSLNSLQRYQVRNLAITFIWITWFAQKKIKCILLVPVYPQNFKSKTLNLQNLMPSFTLSIFKLNRENKTLWNTVSPKSWK